VVAVVFTATGEAILLAQEGVPEAFRNIQLGAAPNWPAVGVVGVALVGILYGVWDLSAQNRERRKSAASLDNLQGQQGVLQNQVGDLQHRLDDIAQNQTTMPERGFVKGWTEAMSAVYGSAMLVLRGRQPATPAGGAIAEGGAPKVDDSRPLSAADCEVQLLACLESITNAIRVDDQAHRPPGPEVHYSANVMIHVSQAGIKDPFAETLQKQLKFAGNSVDVHTLTNGVLLLMPEWSFTTLSASSASDKRDSKLTGLVLPLPEDCDPRRNSPMLPGAPAAWCKGTMDVCPDVFQIGKKMLKDGSGLVEQADAIGKHFAETTKHVGSFISLAIVSVTAPQAERGIGVLNINCSAPGLLQDDKRQELMLPHLMALVRPLADIIEVTLQRTGDETHAGAAS